MKEKKIQTRLHDSVEIKVPYTMLDVYVPDAWKGQEIVQIFYPLEVLRTYVKDKYGYRIYSRFNTFVLRGAYKLQKHFGVTFIDVQNPMESAGCSVKISFSFSGTKKEGKRNQKKLQPKPVEENQADDTQSALPAF